ncbi:MAG: Flp pilus assembly complex ATPase component TadA, partial [Roseomonas sp.]|nr:Flp pilus assembly complex ATPase component TadA [Roseomonas sp.]
MRAWAVPVPAKAAVPIQRKAWLPGAALGSMASTCTRSCPWTKSRMMSGEAAWLVRFACIKVLSRLKLDEKRLPQDGRFKIEADGERVSFRVSILPTYYGEKTVMRLLRDAVSGFTLEGLGF